MPENHNSDIANTDVQNYQNWNNEVHTEQLYVESVCAITELDLFGITAMWWTAYTIWVLQQWTQALRKQRVGKQRGNITLHMRADEVLEALYIQEQVKRLQTQIAGRLT